MRTGTVFIMITVMIMTILMINVIKFNNDYDNKR